MKSKKLVGVVLAGGKGTRLRPYTTFVPKPLMPIGDIPILEVVLRQMKEAGIHDIVLAVGYQASLIQAFVGDGSALGLNIKYSNEAQPLGTAGPLKCIDFAAIFGVPDAIVAMNGDILSTLKLKAAVDWHFANQAAATICMNERKVAVDFGVIKADASGRLQEYNEKPVLNYEVSMGINIFSPAALDSIPEKSVFNIPDLMLKLHSENQKVLCYRSDAYWLDIGRIEDYATACEIFEARRSEFLDEE